MRKAFKSLRKLLAFAFIFMCITQIANAEIAEGYYRIISAGNGPGYSGGPYNYEYKYAWYNEDGLVKWMTYNTNDYCMIYKITKDQDGENYNIYNLRDQSYVNVGTQSFGDKVSTSATATPQTIIPIDDEKFIIRNSNSRYFYSITHSHNGLTAESSEISVWGTEDEAIKYGINVWYLNEVPEDIVNYLEQNDTKNGYSISETPTNPIPGKIYVLKNASNNYYLTSNSSLTTTVDAEPEYFWTITESGKYVDGNPTYYLKSICKDAYWKYINYGSQTWEGNSPYDGYDWYNYAGINAEFSSIQDAMEVTVLEAGSTGTWRSAGASKGYVIAMKDPIVCAGTQYYYKLGTQSENVAMEPWNEDVGWYFLPVVNGNDVFEELQNTIGACESFGIDVTASNDPGYFSIENINAFKVALDAAKAIKSTDARSTIKAACASLKDAYETAQEVSPIREGYFYIVTAGNGSGYSGGPYNDEWKAAMYNDGDLVKWRTYDPNDFEQIYQFVSDGNGNFYVKSALNGTYINKGASSYSTKISTSLEAKIPQTFQYISEGKFTIKFYNNSFVYSVKASHNGTTGSDEGTLNIWGTPEEASKYGVNVWYIHEVPDSIMTAFAKTDAGLRALCASYESIANSLEIKDAPGYYIEENVTSFKNVIKEAKALAFEDSSEEERLAIRETLAKAYEKALETKPLTDGFYYLVNNYEAYIKSHGNNPAIYTATGLKLGVNGSACYYDKFDKNNANYIYRVTSISPEENTFSIQNAYTKWFLNTGDGNNASGEVLTCTSNYKTPQIVKVHTAGKFWISDEIDNTVGHAIANAAAVNKRDIIIGSTSFNSQVSQELMGYNTWSFIPVSSTDAYKCIEQQKATDLITSKAFNNMKAYTDSISGTYNTIINDKEGNYNADAVTVLKTKAKAVSNYITSRPYDITSVANDYNVATDELKKALELTLTTKPDTATMRPLTGNAIGAISVDYSTSQQSTTVNAPKDAFDNDLSTFYAAYERSTGWVGLDLGEKHIIKKVAYSPRSGWASRMVLGVFEGANKEDFSDAIPFHIIKSSPEQDKMTYEQVNCSRGFRYVRYVGPNDARTNVAEIRFYGEPGEGDDTHLYQVTNLPLVVIRTVANVPEITSRTTWLPGHAHVISDNGSTLKSDSMNVRGRGNGSWTFEKKPYKLKFANKTKLLHMPAKAKEWTLINNYGDKTMIRNNVAFKISEIMEMDYTPANSLVDVVFNGQYKGSYQLCDQVEVHKKRVEVTEMDSDDNAGDSITGGYLIELDAYAGGEPRHFNSTSYGIPVTVHYPDNDDITEAQFNYIRQAFNDVCDRVYSKDYKDSIKGYSPVFDEKSWLKYLLIEELSGNTDGYWSTYLYKDRNDKFRTAPVWDFDLAFDNDGRTHNSYFMNNPQQFLCLSSCSSAASGVRNFNRKIVESCTKELTELWSWYRYKGDLNYETLKAAVDSLGAENTLSAEWNYIRWDILNRPTQQQYTVRGSYAAEVEFLNEYLYDRIAWLDNFVGLEEPIGVHSALDEEPRGGIHGHDGYVLIRGFNPGSTIDIYSTNGILVSSSTVNDFDNRVSLPKGLYIIKVTETNNSTTTQKVAIK